MKKSRDVQKSRVLVLLLGVVLGSHCLTWAQTAGGPGSASAGLDRPRLVVQLGHSGAVTALAVSPDGRLMLTGSVDHNAILRDAAIGREIRRFQTPDSAVTAVAFSPDGRFVLLGTGSSTAFIRNNNPAYLFEAATGKEIRRFQGHPVAIESVAFSPDGYFVLLGNVLREVATGNERGRFRKDAPGASSVAFSPDGRFALTVNLVAQLWDIATGNEVRPFREEGGHIMSFAVFAPDEHAILTVSNNHIIRLWDPATGNEVRHMEVHQSSGGAASWTGRPIASSPDGRLIATSQDRTAFLWEPSADKGLSRLEGSAEAISSAAISPDGRFIATGVFDAFLLWETTTGRATRFRCPGFFSIPSFAPDGKSFLALAGGTPLLWDTTAGKEVPLFDALGPSGLGVLSPDGQSIFVSGCFWDITSGKQRRNHCLETDPPNSGMAALRSAAFSPDGRLLVVCSVSFCTNYRLLDFGSALQIALFPTFAKSNRKKIYATLH